MRRRRKYLIFVAMMAAAAVATPVLAQMAFDSSDRDLVLGRWDNAVVLFDEDGEAATVVLVYNAGERDPARRLEIEQQDEPGVDLTIALLLEPDDDTIVKPLRRPVCVKGRVRGLRSSPAPDIRVSDRNDTEIEGRAAPDGGFVLPPLSKCRTVGADVVSE